MALALHSALKYLDNPNTYARMPFMDYSSAFNTAQPIKLVAKLADLGLPTPTCNWISDCLSDRPWVMRVGNMVLAVLNISTGTPKGCCLSSRPFSLYKYDCRAAHELSHICKFADDTTILGLIKGHSKPHYRQLVENTLNYGEENNLVLGKTKELILDFRKKAPPLQPLWIKSTASGF